MTAILAFLVKHWRIFAYAAAALVLVWVVLLVLHWRKDSVERLPEVQAALKAEVACEAPSKCAERTAALVARQAVIQQETVESYETQLAEIAARPAPAGPVRLCRPANRGVRVAGSPSPASTDGGSELQVEVSRDIAVELYRLADDADTEALKLRLLWDRDQALAKAPE